MTNEIQEMLALVGNIIPGAEEAHFIDGWVNGNLYLRSDEVSGVLPIPVDIRIKYGMAEYQSALHSTQSQHFLASRQQTRKPVLPIHNDTEREEFRKLVAHHEAFTGKSGPDFDTAVKLWNDIAAGTDGMAYKVRHLCIDCLIEREGLKTYLQLPEHLKAYYNGEWKTQSNIKQTLAMTSAERRSIKKIIRDPRRALAAPPVKDTSLEARSVTSGLLPLPPLPSTSSDTVLYTENSLIATTSTSASHVGIPESNMDSSNTCGHVLSLQDKQKEIGKRLAAKACIDEPPKKKAKRPKQCRKCKYKDQCNGRQNIGLCKNPCKDCGIVQCRGRNTNRPNLPCHLAWD